MARSRIANLTDWLSEAAVVRNAGGRATDALRSIATLDAIAGITAIIVVHHTGKRKMSRPVYLASQLMPQ